MVTSRDVAKLAGVSQATISRALSSSPKITDETKAIVRAAADALNYVPHASAQAMRTKRTNAIGVVVDDLSNPFYLEILDELTKELDAANYRVVVWNAGGSSHHDALNAIQRHAVDGVILTAATDDSIELRAALERNSLIVLINRLVEGLECDQVSSDNMGGGSAVADYLVEHGKTSVAFIGGTENASTSRDRGRGFFNRMAELGHPVPPDRRFTAGFSHDLSFQTMSMLLALPGAPQAVFCANDYMAFGALDAIRSRGTVAASECWVIGYDDVDMAAWPSFDLTTIRQPSREMARAGARALIERIQSPERPLQAVNFPFELVVRGSTGMAASRGEDLRK